MDTPAPPNDPGEEVEVRVLIEAGVPLVAISQRLGHQSLEQTLEAYGHLWTSSR